jgi:prevent-host-death family protein
MRAWADHTSGCASTLDNWAYVDLRSHVGTPASSRRNLPASGRRWLTRLTIRYAYCVAETVPLSEAKTRLSELIRRVEAGEQIVIRRGRTPVARLVPERATRVKPPGALRGRVEIAPDFDLPLPEFAHLLPDA